MTNSRTKTIAILLLTLANFASISQGQAPSETPAEAAKRLYSRDNLIAWCIVPFDSKKRAPEERAAMLEKLGFKHFAYDWRTEHIPTFDDEIKSLKKHGVGLDAFWVAPGVLNTESRLILDTLKRNGVKSQLWVLLDFGADKAEGAEQARRVNAAADSLKPLAEEAAKAGCTLALYNHGGWFGEPENQIAIIEALKSKGIENVGLVYNLHHGHDHLDRFSDLLVKMKPYLVCLNLNGMDRGGDKVGRKILPLGQGALDLQLLRTIRDSGYHGPIGILGHTQDDAEERLKDNLDGLDWLVPQLDGKPAGAKPKPRTPVANGATPDQERVAKLLAEAKSSGDASRGALVFSDTKFACASCHKVGTLGGSVGPELTSAMDCPSPEQMVASLLWPKREIKTGYAATVVATADGRVIQGYIQKETSGDVAIRESASGSVVTVRKAEIEDRREIGTLMPEGLTEAMTADQTRDLVRFLLDLSPSSGSTPESAEAMLRHSREPAAFTFTNTPLHPEDWPNHKHPVNRDRHYDFYAKEAEHFANVSPVPHLLPQFPGLDGGVDGHWGNQNEKVWSDARWNESDLGSLLSGVFHGAGKPVSKAICVRLGDRGELSCCFNPETLAYEAVWRGGFVKFPATRHGFMNGLTMDGELLTLPDEAKAKTDKPFAYHGFYRNGNRVIFAYRLGDEEMLDSPWVENGKFTRIVGPAKTHPLAAMIKGGPSQWPQVLETKGELGKGLPYAVDTITPPFQNPWKSLLFFGDHDFLPDGSALICTMQGDVWKVEGLDETLASVKWRRIATGLHHALGLVVADGNAYVLGRDQITRLHDLNGDGEADFYECVSNRFKTSPGGHDFTCALQRDTDGNFYTASGPEGILKIPANGKPIEVVASGFRNPDGLGLSLDGTLTTPTSEGEWTPASMIFELKPGGFYGYGGPKDGKPPELPLVYLPRGLDNSSGGQVFVPDDRWGPLRGQMIHLSFGAGSHFLVLRDRVQGQVQGTVVPLPGDFRSGVHRGRFSPKDGQLYVSGMAGWGSYTPDDGCFQRVRYTGDPVQLPVALRAHENGVAVTFSSPVDPSFASDIKNTFAQAWNYRYGSQYGSPELSARHPDTPGHDPVIIRSSHVSSDQKTVFLEIPDLQPVNQLHLHMKVDDGRPIDMFATLHKLADPFTAFPGYRPEPKIIAAHPILADLARMKPSAPNPWRAPISGARTIVIQSGANLSFVPSAFSVKAGEAIELTFQNTDAVPHNWALIQPGSLSRVGDLANKLIADPEAANRQYIPKSDDVLAYTDVVEPGKPFRISFLAPKKPGRYPFLCTFPGHWMIMNGVMTVE